jgi:phage baseplate assembly protein W
MHLDYPLRFQSRGRTAETSDEGHLRDLIEQLLFTAPGERVNRPDFGSGLLQLVFAPTSDEVIATTQFLVQGALQQWLGDLIDVDTVDVSREGGELRVLVRYVVRRTREQQAAAFARQAP